MLRGFTRLFSHGNLNLFILKNGIHQIATKTPINNAIPRTNIPSLTKTKEQRLKQTRESIKYNTSAFVIDLTIRLPEENSHGTNANSEQPNKHKPLSDPAGEHNEIQMGIIPDPINILSLRNRPNTIMEKTIIKIIA